MIAIGLMTRPLEQRHPHDCSQCIYLGTWRQREDEGELVHIDLYVCPRSDGGSGTLIAREGVDGDYRSGMAFAQMSDPLACAALIALKRGLLNEGLLWQINDPAD